jgi:hypothetical protein
MMGDPFLSDAGSLFFAVWSLVIGAVTLKAFGRDLLSSKAASDASGKPLDKARRLPSRPR